MFRQLEQFLDKTQTDFVKDQQTYFKTLPNLTPYKTSGLNGFNNVIQTTDTNYTDLSDRYQPPSIYSSDSIFKPTVGLELSEKNKVCQTSTLPALRASQPTTKSGCGWLYSPPLNGSATPQLSKGFLGTRSGPFNGLNPPQYKQWFYDLNDAQKQVDTDICKSLTNCSSVSDPAYKNCGYCTEKNYGVPVDNSGNPKYGGQFSSCSPNSIITTPDKCPPPETVTGDQTCVPIDGKLSVACIKRNVRTAGCSEKGALFLALSNSTPNHYLSDLKDSSSYKIYKRYTKDAPFNYDFIDNGRLTITNVLDEVGRIASHTSEPEDSALGAASRDLCMKAGAIQKYNICYELTDTDTAPFTLECLQNGFLEIGGVPRGISFPTIANLNAYNNLGNWGAVKQYWNTLISNLRSTDYTKQSEAMLKMLGITPESAIQRAPYVQGVEIFWFIHIPGNPLAVIGLYRRTIEPDLFQFTGRNSFYYQTMTTSCAILQLTDYRIDTDITMKPRVLIDDGFWMSISHPKSSDAQMFRPNIDEPGRFGVLKYQGPTQYQANSEFTLTRKTPNIMKVFVLDQGGYSAFQMNPNITKGSHTWNANNYSLTLERDAPFIAFEVNKKASKFEELRNPGMFSQFINLRGGVDIHSRTDECVSVPGKMGFVRIKSNQSLFVFPNICYQSWQYVTFAFRLKSKPVKETMFEFQFKKPGVNTFSCVAMPRGNTVDFQIEYNLGSGKKSVALGASMALNDWYYLMVQCTGTGFNLKLTNITYVAQNGLSGIPAFSVDEGTSIYSRNASWSPIAGQALEACTMTVGAMGLPFGTSAFEYDLAWIHYFDTESSDMFKKDAAASWKYTTFPDTYQRYI